VNYRDNESYDLGTRKEIIPVRVKIYYLLLLSNYFTTYVFLVDSSEDFNSAFLCIDLHNIIVATVMSSKEKVFVSSCVPVSLCLLD